MKALRQQHLPTSLELMEIKGHQSVELQGDHQGKTNCNMNNGKLLSGN